MSYKRKGKAFSTSQILFILFGVLLILVLFKGEINLGNLLSIILVTSCFLFFLAMLFLLINGQNKKARLKAIKFSEIDKMTGIQFEKYIGDLLRFRGYAIEFTSVSHDFGVDIVARKDGIKTAIQLKRYSGLVGRSAISDAVAGIAHYKCSQSMVVTNYYFTKEAKELAKSNKCELVDRNKLSEWIYDFQRK